MLHPSKNPVPKVKNDIGNQDNQFYELMKEISYACRKLQLKKWNRQWKINLIENDNSQWLDLWQRIQ